MNTTEWLSAEHVEACARRQKTKAAPRSTNERLKATLRHDEEAMSPRSAAAVVERPESHRRSAW